MAIGTRTSGAWASGSTSSSPALPASVGAGDMMILFVGAKPYTATINQPTGWTRIGTQQTNGTTASGIDTGSVTWSVFYREWQSGDAAPSVSVTSGNVHLSNVAGFTKGSSATWVTPTAYFGSDTTSGTGYSITASGSSGNITANDYLHFGTVIAGNDATFGSPTITATSATIGTVTESPATEGTTATGNDLEASIATAPVTAGTSTADAVCGWTLSVAQTGGSALVRLREDLTQTLTPSLFSNTTTYYDPTVTPGAVTLTPSLYSNTGNYYAPTVVQITQLTQSSRFDVTNTIYSATVTPGTVTLTPGLYSNSLTSYTHTLTPGQVSLTSNLYTNVTSYYSPTVTPGQVTLTPSLYSNSTTYYSPTVTQVQLLTASKYDNTVTFYVTTVTPGEVTLLPSLYTNTAQFFVPTVLPGIVTLLPGFYQNTSSYYTPIVDIGDQVLLMPFFNNTGSGQYDGSIKYDLSTGRLAKIINNKIILTF